jgi:hypothetical protein
MPLPGALLLSILFFNFFSKAPFEEKHKDSHYSEKNKQVRTPSIFLPILDSNVSRKDRHYNVCVFKKSVYFTPHQFLFYQ